MEAGFLVHTIISAGLYRGFRSEFLELVLNAGLVVKLVLAILLLLSVISWAIIFFKFKMLRKADGETAEFLRSIRAKKDFSVIYSESRNFRYTPLVHVFRAGYNEMKRAGQSRSSGPDEQEPSEMVHAARGHRITRAVNQAVSHQINRLEENLSFLATTGNAAPFIGLFGTVWGIMEAFQEIGQRGATSLAIVAPGISEALIATAAGLFAAIPAVIAYNYYLNRIRRLVSEMDNFSAELLNGIGSSEH